MLLHDLKTPLATISMACAFIKEHIDADASREQIQKMLSIGSISGQLMSDLLEEIAEVSRNPAPDLSLVLEEIPVSALLDGAWEQTLVAARPKALRLVKEVQEDLPSVRADRSRMSRAVSNLLSNAVAFTPPGGEVRLTVRARDGESIGARGRVLEIAVRDTGAGIRPEHLAYVFDPYWRGPERSSGTGLGLAIVKRIVSAHGGSVSVTSRAGTGSEFRLVLPLDHEACS